MPFIICPTCSGHGHHTNTLGVINPDDFSPDELDDYFAGRLDEACTRCDSTGKLWTEAEQCPA